LNPTHDRVRIRVMHRRLLILMTVALVALGLAACGSSSKKSSPSTSTPTLGAATGSTIQIKDFVFSVATVKAGATVTVRNTDSTTHTVTSDKSGQFNSGNVNAGSSVTFTAPAAAGSYAFHCNFHSFMHGTLTVT
jgi:plastocyanin